MGLIHQGRRWNKVTVLKNKKKIVEKKKAKKKTQRKEENPSMVDFHGVSIPNVLSLSSSARKKIEGWKRYEVEGAKNIPHSWKKAYHGTLKHFLPSILTQGLRPGSETGNRQKCYQIWMT